jgi:hypothetical protein
MPIYLPTAPPLSDLHDNYTNAQCTSRQVENHAPRGREDSCAFNQQQYDNCQFFSQAEQDVLNKNASSMPIDYYLENSKGSNEAPSGFVNIPTATVVGESSSFEGGGNGGGNGGHQFAPSAPLLVTENGVPLYDPASQQPSLADTEFDGYKGVSSSDELLQADETGGEILKFLNTHNVKPRQLVSICGYHYETRCREVREEDDNGNTRWRTEDYEEYVCDFDYRIDISDFIYP